MSATPRTKYAEYRQKMLDWGRIFEEEYGSPPTEEDKTSSQTWTALNEKSVQWKPRYVGDTKTVIQLGNIRIRQLRIKKKP